MSTSPTATRSASHAPWTWPELFDGISTAKAQAVQRAVAEGKWRKDPRSTEWVGIAVAQVLGLDPDPEADRKRISALIKEWVKNDVLREVEGQDEKRNTRAFSWRSGNGSSSEKSLDLAPVAKPRLRRTAAKFQRSASMAQGSAKSSGPVPI
jgi:hypothetical protein